MPNEASLTPKENEVVTPPPAETNGSSNGKVDGQAGHAASVNAEASETGSESFTSTDIEKLPPEIREKVKPIYENMNRDYLKKTSEIAQRRREMEGLEQKAKSYDQISNDPAFVEYWNGLSRTQQAQVKEDAGISDDEFNRAFESKDNFAKFIQKVAQVSTAQSQTEITNLKADLMIKDFKARTPDFDELKEAIEIQVKADPRSYSNDPKQWEKAMSDAVSQARAYRDRWVDKGRKEGLARVSEKANNSTNPPTSSPEQIYPGGDPKNLSVSDAIDLARRGIKVPR